MKLVVSLLFLIPTSLFAQQNGGEWHFGISGGPETSAITIQNEFESTVAEYGFFGGLSIGFNLATSFTWQTGIYYGVKNINYTQGGLIFDADIDPEAGVTGNSERHTNMTLTEIEIPLQIKYFFYKSFYARTGLGLNFLNERAVENRVDHSDGTTTALASDPRSSVNTSAIIGMGYMQPIGEKFNFNIEPYIKYYFRDNIIPTTHLYNIGLKATFTVKLSK